MNAAGSRPAEAAQPHSASAVLAPDLSVRHEFRAGDIGYITYLHGLLYAREQGWDHTFEAYVAGPLAEFSLRRSDRERIWIMEQGGRIVGTIAIVAASPGGAQLLWLLLDPAVRGRGAGRWLVERAVEFCRGMKYRSVFLWTVDSLAAAGGLYRAVGFRKTTQQRHELWGKVVTEERYDLVFDEA